MAKVYYSKEISPEGLMKVYKALGVELPGRVGVKVSTGEKGAKGYLKADLIGPFVKSLNGTIVECNTAYGGERNTVKDHMKVAEEHGFTSFAEVDIMDAEGELVAAASMSGPTVRFENETLTDKITSMVKMGQRISAAWNRVAMGTGQPE